ncbi:MOG interacting and ectopic P-granules protein 1, partial [Eumeta japonica]
MNGEVNGMEEPMDTSLPSSPAETINLKTGGTDTLTSDTVLTHCDNSNNTETSDHVDSDHSQDALDNDADHLHTSYSGNENSNDSNHQDSNSVRKLNIVPVENVNSIPNDNHCSNSNESYPESMDSSQHKQEIVHQVDVHVSNASSLHSNERSKIDDADLERDCEKIITANDDDEDSDDEVDSEEDSSEEEGSDSEEPRAEDTVSINSDSDADGGDETSQESHSKQKSDVVIVDQDNRSEGQSNDTRNAHSPEIHEIISDNEDCVLANDDKLNSENSEPKPEEALRRSSRAIKRKRYNEGENGDEESDIEEVTMEDPLNQFQNKNKPIVVNDTKELVEMASKQIKTNQGNSQKKEPTVVIIDTNSILSGKGPLPLQNKNSVATLPAMSTQNLYQSIAARGTTVTPVSGKQLTNSATQSATITQQPLILPSLTDDMFVVEAPSFIVPYVYEKPSIKPFREFVDMLGKEIEEIKAKEEKERLEKEKIEKEKRDKERRERGEYIEEEIEKEKEKEEVKEEEEVKEVKDVKEEVKEVLTPQIETPQKKKNDKKDRKRRRNEDDDDASWDGESTTDSEDEVLSDDENKIQVIKDKYDSIDEFKDLTTEKITTGKSDNYFDCSLGKFFINIGLNLVQEYVQHDLLKQQNRKLYKEKKAGHNTKPTETSISSLMKNLEFSKENNAPYVFKQKKCDFCTFKTESMLVMVHHLETPHMKNNVYKCNFCTFEIRSPHDILYHMEAEHNIRGRLERAPAYHQCANCPFEDNGKGKLVRHLIPCAKKFKPELNLAPPIEWEPPAKYLRASVGNNVGRPALNIGMMPGVVGSYRPRGRAPLGVPPRAAPVHGAPLVRGGIMMRHNAPNPVVMPNNYPIMQNNQTNKTPVVPPKTLHHQPSISITPLPRPPQPPQPQPPQHNKGTFVICEICDGYIKDLEQLRNHMQWIHKVKIHPKMIYNRPPLNCQKCQF